MVSTEVAEVLADWRLESPGEPAEGIDALLEPLYARGLLPDGHDSVDAILMGDQYHLGGTEDTRQMAQIAGITAADRVVDLACYIGGPARQLAREYGCDVVGVDISDVHIAVAERLTELSGLEDKVTFLCESADATSLPAGSFAVAWSQCSFPSDLSWLEEMDRLLRPGGRVAFTGLIRRAACEDTSLLTLNEIGGRVAELGYDVVSAEDISELDLDHGWLPALARLRENEARYRELVGEKWIRKAEGSITRDIAEWREGKMGNGRVVAVKK